MKEIQEFIDLNSDKTINLSLGKYSKAFGFDPNLFGVDNYNKIHKLLESCKIWESSEEEILEDYKENYELVDAIILTCPDSPFDIMVSAVIILDEVHSPGYKKNIINYSRKFHKFNISTVSDNEYYFDLTILNNKIDSRYLAESSYLKILDIIDIFKEKTVELTFVEPLT
jgi:hypothetical protein